jgi:glycosyltransferase involved in cell wall biosynthesis
MTVMNGTEVPSKVLITGGHEVGGVSSFAEGLRDGFAELGIPTEIIAPSQIWSRWHQLRDSSVLKILSTTGVFAAPLAQRTICIAHGIPRVCGRGWARFLSILGTFKLANACSGAQLVAVSHYTAVHLETVFNVRIDGVVLNPLKPLFLDPVAASSEARAYITYVGRLDPIKNLHRLLPSVRQLLDEIPHLHASIVGDGEQRMYLQREYGDHPRIHFEGCPDDRWVRNRLRQTKLFISGNTTEGLGITYLEALSQGCAVAMPACGGGLEVALDQIGRSVHLLPLSLDPKSVLEVLRRAISSNGTQFSVDAYSARAVAEAYLKIDARRQHRPMQHKAAVSPASNSR